MIRGQSIKIFLVDGTPSGIKAVELSNWTGKGIVFSKGLLAQLAQRKESFKPGIYMLTGTDPENISRDIVYIGEAENIFNRMKQHSNDPAKDFWENTVFFTSKDENLTKSHIKYLESRIIGISKESARCTINNSTSPEPTPLPESDIADMETFLDHMKMILPILGFDFMEPAVNTKNQNDDKLPIFIMNPVGTNATAKVINGKMVVLKGSTARKDGIKTWTSYKQLRDELVDEKILEPHDEKSFIFTRDYEFNSPSAAAAVVFAGNQNGLISWKTKEGKTFKQWQEEIIEKAENESKESRRQHEENDCACGCDNSVCDAYRRHSGRRLDIWRQDGGPCA